MNRIDLDLEAVHRKLRFGWELERIGSQTSNNWQLINRRERVLHPVGKIIPITKGAPHMMQRAKMLKVVSQVPGKIVFGICKEWDHTIEEG